MRKVLATLALLVMSAFPAAAQDRSQGGFSDQFTFDAHSLITTWNGVTNAYDGDMGSVSIQSQFGGGYGSAIDVPFQLGYLNNGFLSQCQGMDHWRWYTCRGCLHATLFHHLPLFHRGMGNLQQLQQPIGWVQR
jgi:hypothetical protein